MKNKNSFLISDIPVGLGSDFFVIAGPCVLESENHAIAIAGKLTEICMNTDIPIIFKSSFDKANRTKPGSFRGPGMDGLLILNRIRRLYLPVLTDVHETWQVENVAPYVDCLQIPAFLCRQTDLILKCAQTGKPINVKKGQWMSPLEMRYVVSKLEAGGTNKILLTERGTVFGYDRLVNDMTSISIMQEFGYPVIFDATHSLKGLEGERNLAAILARSAVAAGANGIFLEVHEDPVKAKCDSQYIFPLDRLQNLIEECQAIHNLLKRKH